MSIFIDWKAGSDLGIPFSCIDGNGALLSGQAASLQSASMLRDQDGAASEPVTVTEQGTSGIYEAHFTPTRSAELGHAYLLRITHPAASDGAITEYRVRVFAQLAVTPTTGTYLTTLANVKEMRGITGAQQDAVLTALIARVSTMIESRAGRIMQTSWQEIRDGNGTSRMVLRHRPVISVAAVYMSEEQVWDSSTLLAATAYKVDREAGILYRRNGGYLGATPQDVRIDYDSGYGAVPLDVEHYAIKKVLEFFDQKDQLGITTITLKDGSITRSAQGLALMSDMQAEIGRYVHRRYS